MFLICKINVAKPKNQNGGLIQGGDEIIFYFSNSKPSFYQDFL
jgi:hypothetical protein